MKLVLVAQDFPPERGGIQTYCFELARRWSQSSTDFRVIARDQPGAARFDLEHGLRVRRIRATGNEFFLKAALALPRAPDVHSFHSQWPSAGPALVLHRLGLTGKVFAAAHGRELYLRPWSKHTRLQRWYDAARQRTLVGVHGVFAVSRFTNARLLELGVLTHHAWVVGNGADPDAFIPGSDRAWRRTHGLEDRIVFLAVSRLVARKGLDVSLKALSGLLRSVPSALLVIVGDGPDRARLVQMCRELGVEQHVRFQGGVPACDLKRWYRAADVFLLPARSAPPDVEGFGIVYLEASASGLPVIGPAEGGPLDAIRHGDTGYVVPPLDADALRKTMQRLAEDPEERLRLGANGRSFVVDDANWEARASQLWQLLSVQVQDPSPRNRLVRDLVSSVGQADD